MRCGLFLIVCTPSGVSVESMMYVGMSSPSVVVLAFALGPVVPDQAVSVLDTSAIG
jgi:hypothetical protein